MILQVTAAKIVIISSSWDLGTIYVVDWAQLKTKYKDRQTKKPKILESK